MGIRFYNLNGFFVKKLAHGVKYIFIIEQIKSLKFNCITFFPTGYTEYTYFRYMPKCICTMLRLIFNGTSGQPENLSIPRSPLLKTVKPGSAELL